MRPLTNLCQTWVGILWYRPSIVDVFFYIAVTNCQTSKHVLLPNVTASVSLVTLISKVFFIPVFETKIKRESYGAMDRPGDTNTIEKVDELLSIMNRDLEKRHAENAANWVAEIEQSRDIIAILHTNIYQNHNQWRETKCSTRNQKRKTLWTCKNNKLFELKIQSNWCSSFVLFLLCLHF